MEKADILDLTVKFLKNRGPTSNMTGKIKSKFIIRKAVKQYQRQNKNNKRKQKKWNTKQYNNQNK